MPFNHSINVDGVAFYLEVTGHLNPKCCKWTCLILLYSRVVGTQKPSFECLCALSWSLHPFAPFMLEVVRNYCINEQTFEEKINTHLNLDQNDYNGTYQLRQKNYVTSTSISKVSTSKQTPAHQETPGKIAGLHKRKPQCKLETLKQTENKL